MPRRPAAGPAPRPRRRSWAACRTSSRSTRRSVAGRPWRDAIGPATSPRPVCDQLRPVGRRPARRHSVPPGTAGTLAAMSQHTMPERIEQLEQAQGRGAARRLRAVGRAPARQGQAAGPRAHRVPARPGLVPRARHAGPPPRAGRPDRGAALHRRRHHRLGHDRRPQGLRLLARTSPSSAVRSARCSPRRSTRSWTWPCRSARRSSASTTAPAPASRRASSRWPATAASSTATCWRRA